MDKDPRFIPITGTRPEDLIKGPMIRRLCICRFQCPLCMKDHEAHLYISFSAADLDEYVAKLREFASDWVAIEPTVTRETVRFHRRKGDLHQLILKAGREGLPHTTPPSFELTGESNYTCDHCSRTFDTVFELQEHMDQHR